ncbi:MAG: DNA polymerase III subunit delta [Lentimicrobiaceae bacterium]|nr:DNA polymerase III subunit delta [Lentimicrobiaceae bacterium]
MTYEQILSDIKKKVYYPIYFLMGEEPFFIDTISDELENSILDEAERSFNQIILYGNDVNAYEIMSQARAFPMMGDKLVVIVKEAQNVKDIESIADYLDKIPPTTILVFNYKYKKLDKRKSLAKIIDKKGVLFESKKLYDNNIPDWIVKYLASRKYNITQKACQMIADFLGNDLHKVRNELDKLMLALPSTKRIDDADVEYNIGISKDFNVFELQKAIGAKDTFKANQIINYFGDNPNENPIFMTIVILYGYYTKLLKLHFSKDKSKNNLATILGVNPFFVNDYLEAARNYSWVDCMRCIEVLREYDMKSKGYNSTSDVSQKELYREMLFKLMNTSDL